MKRPVARDRRYKKSIWTQNQKLQAVTTYAMLGNMTETALVTSIPLETLKGWKLTPWFKETLLQIRDEDIQKLDGNLQRVATKALASVEDRLDKGDFQYDPRTGKPMRIPVKAQVALRITTDLLDRQDKIRNTPDKVEVEKTIDARLAKLSEEFARFATSRLIEGTSKVIVATPIEVPAP